MSYNVNRPYETYNRTPIFTRDVLSEEQYLKTTIFAKKAFSLLDPRQLLDRSLQVVVIRQHVASGHFQIRSSVRLRMSGLREDTRRYRSYFLTFDRMQPSESTNAKPCSHWVGVGLLRYVQLSGNSVSQVGKTLFKFNSSDHGSIGWRTNDSDIVKTVFAIPGVDTQQSGCTQIEGWFVS